MGASLRIIGFHPLRLALTLCLFGGLRQCLSFPSFVVIAWRRSFGSIVFVVVQICLWWVVDGGSCPSPCVGGFRVLWLGGGDTTLHILVLVLMVVSEALSL
jgi:hypothetical protein